MVAVLSQNAAPTKADFHAAIASRSGHWYSACLRITRDEDLAADAVQDALLSAWNKRHQFEASAKLETWIHRIAVNAALQLLRKRHPERYEPLDFEVADDADAPEDCRANAELGSRLSASLEGLTDIERVCFCLKHLEQWRIREIAAELGANDGSVKQALLRAVRKLRVSLADLGSQHDE